MSLAEFPCKEDKDQPITLVTSPDVRLNRVPEAVLRFYREVKPFVGPLVIEMPNG